MKHHGRIIFVVVVKCPEHFDGQVFESEMVGGQIWSYLLAMNAMGDKNPMGTVMTYNKIVLATIENFAQKKKKSEDGSGTATTQETEDLNVKREVYYRKCMQRVLFFLPSCKLYR